MIDNDKHRPIICVDAGNTLLALCSPLAGPIGGNLEREKKIYIADRTGPHWVNSPLGRCPVCQMASPPLYIMEHCFIHLIIFVASHTPLGKLNYICRFSTAWYQLDSTRLDSTQLAFLAFPPRKHGIWYLKWLLFLVPPRSRFQAS